ncbi:MAG: DUF4291 domain-containing protein [Saprospiraceae bacterium]|nr:DUF4291 domain-containing protein [Saprospiraceae bacterium]
MLTSPPAHQIRAEYDERTITVYQAYRKEIAQNAVRAQTFVAPFKIERMTWIKPSFFWMMYRCGWAEKPGQEHVLAIKLRQEGFDWALEHACLSHFDAAFHLSYEAWQAQLEQSPVRVQWDPERDLFLNKLDYRSIQIGLSGEAVSRYTKEWIVEIQDITTACKTICMLIREGKIEEAQALLPKEQVYPKVFPGIFPKNGS